jgi:hypothetical protein
MSSLSQFTGQRVTKSVVHATSTGTPSGAYALAGGAREVLSGALTAATLKTLLTITGTGELFHLSAYTKNATSRTVRCRVTLDGVVVFDVTTIAVALVSAGLVVAGGDPGSSSPAQRGTLRFAQTCVVEVASSLTETDMLAIGYTAQTY